ncbi:MAG: hypothetical protein IPP77_05295 [Bacteroidetes bacterium]|nr:hypothetical protein [Bacteroidota bacterium]
MKRISVLFFVCLFAIWQPSCNSKAKQAKTYHEQILLSVQAVIDSSLDFGDAVQSYEKQRIISTERNYAGLVNRTMNKINATGSFRQDTVLQYYANEMLAFYKKSLEDDILPYALTLPEGELSEVQKHTLDSLYAKMTMMENKYWARFDWAEKKFYQENEISKAE